MGAQRERRGEGRIRRNRQRLRLVTTDPQLEPRQQSGVQGEDPLWLPGLDVTAAVGQAERRFLDERDGTTSSAQARTHPGEGPRLGHAYTYPETSAVVRISMSKRRPVSHSDLWLPCAGMPPASLSIRSLLICERAARTGALVAPNSTPGLFTRCGTALLRSSGTSGMVKPVGSSAGELDRVGLSWRWRTRRGGAGRSRRR